MDTPQKVNHEVSEYIFNFFEFILRNMFGILSALAGILYQIYQMSGRTRRLTKTQCISSVLMWVISSIAIVIGLDNAEINKLIYGLICWLSPIVCKPIADVVSVKITPFTETIIMNLEKLMTKKIEQK